MLGAAAIYGHVNRHRTEDADARLVRKTIEELRDQLHIKPADGYMITGERVAPWLKRGTVVIRKVYMEAAAKLAMWADFDVRLLDAFCVCLLGDEYVEAPASIGFSLAAASKVPERSVQQTRLREWLLALSMELLDPRIEELSSRSDAKIERYSWNSLQRKSVSKSRDEVAAREQLRVAAAAASPTSPSNHRDGSYGVRTSSAASATTGRLGSTFGRTISVAVVRKSSGAAAQDLEEHDALGLGSSTSKRFAYFQSKVLKLQIWREDAEELFWALKSRVQLFMDQLAQVGSETYLDNNFA